MKTQIALIDFFRTPYHKQGSPYFFSLQGLLKSGLLRAFSGHPFLQTQKTKVSFSSSDLGSCGDLDLEILSKCFAHKSLSDFSFLYRGSLASFSLLSEELSEESPFRILCSFDFPSLKTFSKQDLKFTKHPLRVKKSLPELKSLGPEVFRKILGFDYASSWQDLAHREGFTRSEQDNYTFQSLKKFHSSGRSQKRIPLVSEGPDFKVLLADSFSRKQTSLNEYSAFVPLVKEAFSSITGGNSSFFLDSLNFWVVGEKKKAESLGLKVDFVFLGQESSELGGEKEALFRLLEKNKLRESDIGACELSEVYAADALSLSRLVDFVPEERVNSFGGSLAYGYSPSGEGFQMIQNLRESLALSDRSYGLVLLKAPSGSFAVQLFQNSSR